MQLILTIFGNVLCRKLSARTCLLTLSPPPLYRLMQWLDPAKSKGSKFQSLTKMYCHCPVRLAADYANLRRKALWQAVHVKCTQVASQ